MIRIAFLVVFFLLSGCGSPEPMNDENLHVETPDNSIVLEAHDLEYYLDNPEQADAQIKICEETPSQKRSEVLFGNCSYAEKSLMYRGYND